MVLLDGTNVEYLQSEQDYKFLGVPENNLHNVENIIESLTKLIRQRTNVIWSSPLSDFNKVMATNIFVYSSMEYYMWSERFNLTGIRELDKIIREVMKQYHAKYSLQMNATLYLSRQKGCRGLRNLEMVYKKTKIEAMMNLFESADPRIKCVKRFHMERMNKGKSSIINDAVKFAKEDFGFTFVQLENRPEMNYTKLGVAQKTSDKQMIKQLLRKAEIDKTIKEVQESTWQGILLKSRYEDKELIEGCFKWMADWKDCPVQVINDAQSIYLQVIPTLTFQNYRGGNITNSTQCRLCGGESESVKHLLSHCNKFLNTDYKRRHDRAFQYILFRFLKKNGLIDSNPPWFTKVIIKPHYENEIVALYWDIPMYNGYEDDQDDKLFRPDGKIIFKDRKQIYVLEMSVPWIVNRKIKFDEKVEKYKSVIQTLKVDNPLYTVQQITIIIDCLGGYSKSFIEALKLLEFDKWEIQKICLDIQKILITEATSTINKFKVLTMK